MQIRLLALTVVIPREEVPSMWQGPATWSLDTLPESPQGLPMGPGQPVSLNTVLGEVTELVLVHPRVTG